MPSSRLSSATAAGAGYEPAGALRERGLPARDAWAAGPEGRRRAGARRAGRDRQHLPRRLRRRALPPMAPARCPPRKAEGGHGGPSAAPLPHLCALTAWPAVLGAGPACLSGGRGRLRRSKWRLRPAGQPQQPREPLRGRAGAQSRPRRLPARRREAAAPGSAFLRLGRPLGARSPGTRPGYRGSKAMRKMASARPRAQV